MVKRMEKDAHGLAAARGVDELPVCIDCHTSHTIERTELAVFRLSNPDRCGRCHQTQLRTYRLSQHGKAGYLHSAEAADCSDCHIAHRTKPAKLMRADANEFAKTCGKCHALAGPMLVSFQPHADPTDSQAYPLLYWTRLGMHTLLIVVIGFFGIHTILWFPRSWWGRRQERRRGPRKQTESTRYYYRFTELSRALHFTIIISFTGLAMTGIPLRYSDTEWAQWLSGYTVFATRSVAGGLHRFFALITFAYAIIHIVQLLNQARSHSEGLRSWLIGPDSMVFSRKDFVQVWEHIRYFVGRGPRPKFDRWSYWEKFDYWAVFWGVVIIGGSGLMLWFPTFFTRFLPGWTLNVAQIIHSEEALLAVSFIFVVHFFHNVLRGEKFPLDTTMFTGRISEEVFKEEHPEEYERLRVTNQLVAREAPAPTEEELHVARMVFGLALSLGVLILVSLVLSILL
jgi:cytochrome b subunit of formate dehydrogenase